MNDFNNNIRLRIGILFNFSPKWMGGIVYIINLIKTLDFLDDQDKPELTLLYRPDLKKIVDEIKYPYLKALEWRFEPIYKGYILSWLSRKNIFADNILKQNDLDGLYPLHDFPVKTKTNTNLVSWYADLQHKYYPEFFTWRKIIERNARITFMLMNSNDLVVSSQSVADDFARFFRIRNGMKIHIFHFASVIDDFNDLDINSLRESYKLHEEYFMISNQFHPHKNHLVLLKALARLKEKKPDIHLAMTGRFPEASHSPYMQRLHSYIDNYHLQDMVSFLGVIPRKEQLLLMKHSQAVLQPSLFEGWSTVIEDAISLQVPVIASSLPVNIEQLGPNGHYFESHDDAKLAEILCNFPSRNLKDKFYEDYNDRIRKTAQLFINIFKD
jgi:glycosyltransferase involved in cell wall biosynthesis